MTPQLSLVIPVLNDAVALQTLLQALQPWRDQRLEIVVVDGGSCDTSVAVANALADQTLHSDAGRARQMQSGARHAGGQLLWFVHADAQISAPLMAEMLALSGRRCWGRCDVRLDGDRTLFRLIAWLMNRRSRLTGICTGDQGLFVDRQLFFSVGGYADIPLMEDVELSRRLKKVRPPRFPATPLGASSRRWQQHGAWHTIVLMWWLRLQYFLGASPARLHKRYYRAQ